MKKTFAVALAVLLASSLLCGTATARAKHPRDLRYPDITLKTPDYEEMSLENGMAGFYIEDHEIPMVDLYMLIPTSRAPEKKTGLNSLAAWVIRNGGSENRPADEMNAELDFVAARLDIRGGPRSTTVSLNCLKKDFELCMEILGDVLKSPALPDDKIELRRGSMKENVRRENDEPRRVAGREFARIVYGDHPMSWRPTEETLDAITREDIAAYHAAFYRPNNVMFGISGDVTREEVRETFSKVFDGWEQADVVIEPEPEMEYANVPSVNYAYKDISQGVITIGHLGLNSHDDNIEAVGLMNYILGGGSFTSRITQRVRTDEGLAYAAYSQYSSDPWTYGIFAASSQTKSEATGRAAQLMIEIIEDMRENGPTEEEFEAARDRYLNGHVFDYEDKANVVRRLVDAKWEGRPLDYSERSFEKIAAMTLEDVKRAAADYLHPDGLTMMFVGDQEAFDQPLSKFGDVNVIELD